MNNEYRKTQNPEPGKRRGKPETQLREGVDYYLENGRYVFTGHFLLQRGYCCQSGCRHCPYGFHQNTRHTEASADQ